MNQFGLEIVKKKKKNEKTWQWFQQSMVYKSVNVDYTILPLLLGMFYIMPNSINFIQLVRVENITGKIRMSFY